MAEKGMLSPRFQIPNETKEPVSSTSISDSKNNAPQKAQSSRANFKRGSLGSSCDLLLKTGESETKQKETESRKKHARTNSVNGKRDRLRSQVASSIDDSKHLFKRKSFSSTKKKGKNGKPMRTQSVENLHQIHHLPVISLASFPPPTTSVNYSLGELKLDTAFSILRSSLLLMGVDNDRISSIQEDLVQNYVSKPENEFTNDDSRIVDQMNRKINKLNDVNLKHKSAIKIQTLFRTSLVRKRITPILDNESEIIRVKAFCKSFQGLLSIESQYCNNLQILVEQFLIPIRQKLHSGKELVQKVEQTSYIFSNCEYLLEFHMDILQKLEYIYHNDWPLLQNVGSVLLEVAKHFESYDVYAGNYCNAQETLLQLRKDKNGKFDAWLNDIELKCGKSIDYFLSEPVHHISKCKVAIEKLVPHVSPGIEEQNLTDAYALFQEAGKFVMDHLQRSKDTAILMKIQRRMILKKPIDFVKDDRKFIVESQFKVGGHTKVFLLFNDILLIGKPVKNNQFQLVDFRPLDVVQFEEGDSDCNMIIKTPSAVYKLSGKNEDIATWIEHLSEYQESKKWNRTIGIDLVTILAREGIPGGVPSIVTQCLNWIRSVPNGTKTEGLFRISGEHNQITALKKIFDQLPPEARDFSSYSIHAVGGILKMFLRELPEPLIPFPLYEKLLNVENQNLKESYNGPLWTDQYQDILTKENIGESFNTLTTIVKFLGTEVITLSDINKMTGRNTAIVFGPALMRPEIETVETTLNSPMVNLCVQRIIENWDLFFP